MRCTNTELEIETVFSRIMSKDFDLQPDFQRGEVWSIQKKKKMIDSILRGWRIPPIHVIENKKFVDEVLDGQQRLATIRDFMNDLIKIDGSLTPIDKSICDLNGLTFSQLDLDNQRRFKKYSVTIIRLTEYTPEEPAELFYRLNQPATLTSAEQRNAFIGDTRNQIRDLVDIFEYAGARKETIGFSNSRMAYDDVISKFCFTLELGTLKKKITSTDISEKYRNNNSFPDKIYDEAKDVLLYFVDSICLASDKYKKRLYLNKATLFSWLIFVKRYMDKLDTNNLSDLIFDFEYARQFAKGKEQLTFFNYLEVQNKIKVDEYPFFQNMFSLFNQRASMGSTDATSIIYRDIILEVFSQIHFKNSNKNYSDEHLVWELASIYRDKQNLPLSIERIAEHYGWGAIL
ncbi:MAG: hypothetical protein JWM44_3605 [Bacilli bacterium]|nr:hypothetical protein [Bacilli bacterium]